MPALLELRDVWKIYKLGDVEVQALRGISLDVAAHEFVAVMGASGSGKSTFMNVVGCLDQPTSGTYRLDGTLVSGMSTDERATLRNRRIGFVFQQFNLLARTSARAIATRCCWPPESWLGMWSSRPARPTATSAAFARSRCSATGTPA